MKRICMAFLLCLLGVTAYSSDTELPAGIRSVLNLREVPYESLSIHVEDVDTGETVLQWLDGEPRNPASTIKLLTTLVALDTLGYRQRAQGHRGRNRQGNQRAA